MGWPAVPETRIPRRPSAPGPDAYGDDRASRGGPSYDPAAQTRLIPEQGTRPFPAAEERSPQHLGKHRADGPSHGPSHDPAAETRLIPEQLIPERLIPEQGTRTAPATAADTRPAPLPGKHRADQPSHDPAAETRLIPEPETRPFPATTADTRSARPSGRQQAETGAGAGTMSKTEPETESETETETEFRSKSGPDKSSSPPQSGWPDVPRGKRPNARTGAGPNARPGVGTGTHPAPGTGTHPATKPVPRAFVDPDTRQLRMRPPTPKDLAGQAGNAGHTHDPHEVTVQMDVVGPQMEDWLVQQAKGAPGGSGKESDGPVFVDESGRRAGWLRRLGILVGVACAVYAVVIVATLLSGNSDAPWVPVEGQEGDKPAGQVDTSPQPEESVDPSVTAEASPQADPAATTGVVPAPDSGSVVVPTDNAPAPEVPVDPGPSGVEETGSELSGDGQDTELPPDPQATAPSEPVGSPDASPEVTDSQPADGTQVDRLSAGTRPTTLAAGPASPAHAEPYTFDAPDSSPPENIV